MEEEMKEDYHHHQKVGHHRLLPQRKVLLARAASFLLLFLLGYAFGFLHATTSRPPATPSSSSNPQILLPEPITPDTSPSTTSLRPLQQQQQQQQQEPPHDLFRFRSDCAPPLPQSEILPTLLHRIYNGTSPYLHFPPPRVAPLLSPRRVRGWGSTLPVFQTLIEAVRPRTIIEVGTFLGASALHMANLTRDLGSLILCLDDFRGWPGFRQQRRRNGSRAVFSDIVDVNGDVMLMYQFMQNVGDSGETGRVLPVPFSTGSGLAALCEWGVYGDLVEVDAGHDFHSAWLDINRAWAVLRAGGVLFGHDYHTVADDRGVRRAVHLFAKVNRLRVQPHGQHWVLSPKHT